MTHREPIYGPRYAPAREAFKVHHGREPNPDWVSDDRWLAGYVAATEDLKKP